jgi:hypothetical protein
MSDQFNGYHNFKDLPDLQGKQVKLPVGTVVKSTNSAKRSYTLKRAQTVRVNHLGCGESVCVGTELLNGSRRGCINPDSCQAVLEKYGTDCPDALVQHPDATVLHRQVFLPISNPTVVWVGSGGYWCEADLNLATWE